jgi:hypothetical protein
MTTDMYAQCPNCEAVFRGDAAGATLEAKNAYWALRAHIKSDHPEAMVACPRQRESPIGRREEKAAFWDRNGTCSYCGSFSQSQFFAAVEAGAEVGPTDKNYKAYLRGPGVPPATGAAKFYFQHLDEAGRDRFIELFNSKKMTIGYPGHFYSLPFFCAPADAH